MGEFHKWLPKRLVVVGEAVGGQDLAVTTRLVGRCGGTAAIRAEHIVTLKGAGVTYPRLRAF